MKLEKLVLLLGITFVAVLLPVMYVLAKDTRIISGKYDVELSDDAYDYFEQKTQGQQRDDYISNWLRESIEAEYVDYIEDSINTEIAYIDTDSEKMRTILSNCVDSEKAKSITEETKNEEIVEEIKYKLERVSPEDLKDFKECIKNAK